jgi:hypothetical protein
MVMGPDRSETKHDYAGEGQLQSRGQDKNGVSRS